MWPIGRRIRSWEEMKHYRIHQWSSYSGTRLEEYAACETLLLVEFNKQLYLYKNVMSSFANKNALALLLKPLHSHTIEYGVTKVVSHAEILAGRKILQYCEVLREAHKCTNVRSQHSV